MLEWYLLIFTEMKQGFHVFVLGGGMWNPSLHCSICAQLFLLLQAFNNRRWPQAALLKQWWDGERLQILPVSGLNFPGKERRAISCFLNAFLPHAWGILVPLKVSVCYVWTCSFLWAIYGAGFLKLRVLWLYPLSYCSFVSWGYSLGLLPPKCLPNKCPSPPPTFYFLGGVGIIFKAGEEGN